MKRYPALIARTLCGAAFFIGSFSLRAEISPEARAVFERSIEASGGQAALAAVKSVRMEGTMSIPNMGLNATTLSISQYPDKGYVKQVIPGMGEMVQAYNGESGWASDPMQGFRQLSPEELKTMRDQYDGIRDALEFEKRYSSAEVLPGEAVDGVAADVVRAVVAGSGQEETHFYSQESGMLIQMKLVASMGAMGEMPLTMKLSDMQTRDGIVFPTKLTIVNPAMTIEMAFTEFEINGPVDQSIFAPPQ